MSLEALPHALARDRPPPTALPWSPATMTSPVISALPLGARPGGLRGD
jgi:hypothetical protein